MKIQTLTRRIPLTRSLHQFARDHVGSVLERFSQRIAAIHVELCDKNGRRGGGDKRCRIRIQTTAGTALLIEEEQASIRTAIRRAAARAASEVHAIVRQS